MSVCENSVLRKFPTPDVMVDVALFTVYNSRLCVVLMKRPITESSSTPYEGELALLGAYVRIEEDSDTEATAKRILRDKAGLVPPHLEQLFTFSGAFRDPRGWSVSVSYYGIVPYEQLLAENSKGLVFIPVDEVPALPFDHTAIIAKAVARLRSKSAYSSLPLFLLPPTFTINELYKVYEQVMGVEIPMVTFRRKIEAQEIIKALTGKMRSGAHRPAQLYQARIKSLQTFDNTL